MQVFCTCCCSAYEQEPGANPNDLQSICEDCYRRACTGYGYDHETGVKNSEKPVLIAFYPSHDGRLMAETLTTINQVAMNLHRPLMLRTSKGLGQAVACTGLTQSVLRELRRSIVNINSKNHRVRAFWIEDDISLNPDQSLEIAAMVVKADKNGWNITAPYTTGPRGDGTPNWVYYKKPKGGEIGRPFTEQEIRAMQPYDPIDGLAGLGFYYGDVYLDYAFHEGTYNGKDRTGLPSYSGIDWNFYLDRKVELRHYPIFIWHEKAIRYPNMEVLTHPNIKHLDEPIPVKEVVDVSEVQEPELPEIF